MGGLAHHQEIPSCQHGSLWFPGSFTYGAVNRPTSADITPAPPPPAAAAGMQGRGRYALLIPAVSVGAEESEYPVLLFFPWGMGRAAPACPVVRIIACGFLTGAKSRPERAKFDTTTPLRKLCVLRIRIRLPLRAERRMPYKRFRRRSSREAVLAFWGNCVYVPPARDNSPERRTRVPAGRKGEN